MKPAKRVIPKWCKEAKKALIDKDMAIQDLSENIGFTREHVSAVINGRVISPNTQNLICDYLKIV